MENTNINIQEVENTLKSLSQVNVALSGSNDTLHNDIRNFLNRIDPINDYILSETNLTNASKVVRGNVESYLKIAKIPHGETTESFKARVQQELVDALIVKQNPIYNYMLYSTSNKTNLSSIGTLIINDYVTIKNGEEETTYWEVKILADTNNVNGLEGNNVSDDIDDRVWGDTQVVPPLSIRLQNVGNNPMFEAKYYITVSDVEDISNGETFDLLVNQDGTFVTTGTVIEVYKNNKLRKKDNTTPKPAVPPRPPRDIQKHGKITNEYCVVNENTASDIVGWHYIYYADGCVKVIDVHSDGSEGGSSWGCTGSSATVP